MKLGEYERVTDTHVYFLKGPLSQWYPSPFKCNSYFHVIQGWCGRIYDFKNCEQWMMYNKAILMGDYKVAQTILNDHSPSSVKKLGRKIKPFDQPIWDLLKLDIVVEGNYWKFNGYGNSHFKDFLISTGNRTLVEVNPEDSVWGIGLAQDDDLILDEANWKGENLLGKALMKVRDSYMDSEHRDIRNKLITDVIRPIDNQRRGL